MRAIDADALSDWMKDYGQKCIKGERKISLMYVWKHIQDMQTIEPEPLKQVKILATVLDGCPLTEACDKLFDHDRDWCQQHCKPGQDVADAECWMKYAEVMTDV